MSKPSDTIYPGYSWNYYDPEESINPGGSWAVTTAGTTVVDAGAHAEMIPMYGDGVNDTLSRVRATPLVSVMWLDIERVEPASTFSDGSPKSLISLFIPREFSGLFHRGFGIGWQRYGITDDPEWGVDMWLLSTDDFGPGEAINLGPADGRNEILYTRTFEEEVWVDKIYVNGELRAEGPWPVGSGEYWGGFLGDGLSLSGSAFHPTDDDNTVPHHVANLYGFAYGTVDVEEPPVFEEEEEPVSIGGWSAVWGTS